MHVSSGRVVLSENIKRHGDSLDAESPPPHQFYRSLKFNPDISKDSSASVHFCTD